jgi:hypothetical protein
MIGYPLGRDQGLTIRTIPQENWIFQQDCKGGQLPVRLIDVNRVSIDRLCFQFVESFGLSGMKPFILKDLKSNGNQIRSGSLLAED